jgi:hypothetical protein
VLPTRHPAVSFFMAFDCHLGPPVGPEYQWIPVGMIFLG